MVWHTTRTRPLYSRESRRKDSAAVTSAAIGDVLGGRRIIQCCSVSSAMNAAACTSRSRSWSEACEGGRFGSGGHSDSATSKPSENEKNGTVRRGNTDTAR